MQRVWATGAEHDRGPMEWIAAISEQSKVAEHIRLALDAAIASDATIEQCQTGLLAVECTTFLQGGDADLDPLVHVWIRDSNPRPDEALRATALAALAKLGADSALAAYWRAEPADKLARWTIGLESLRERLTHAKRKPDPQKDPRIVALKKSFDVAKHHLRVALVPYELTEDPVVHVRVAPGLSVVVHYAEVGELEPVPVPVAHARAWKKKPEAIARLAAKQTHEASGLRTHILENEGFEINLAFGNSSFTAGLLPYANLFLAAGITAPHGILVAAPNMGTVVYHRIVDAKWNEAAVEIVNQVREMYESSAQRISAQLWWWNAGTVIELPYTKIAEAVIIDAVEPFASAMKKL